jgi:hypothetical protein
MPVKSDVWVGERDKFIELNIHNGSCDDEARRGLFSEDVKINNRDSITLDTQWLN